MTEITGSVGDSDANTWRDVALVQAMLQAIRNADGKRYHDASYDGVFGPITGAAIAAFQRDNGLFDAESGHVTPGGATLGHLRKLLPSDKRDMRIMEGTRIVYLGASMGEWNEGRDAVANAGIRKNDFNFGRRVHDLFGKMYTRHRVALTVAGDGGFRTFKVQAKVESKDVGPGESFHNYGLAVDTEFHKLRFIQRDGTVMDGGKPVLENLDGYDHAAWHKFWEVRDGIATGDGFYPIGAADRPHLRFKKDVSAGRSLVALLNQHKTMKWDVRLIGAGGANIYKCDLGFGKKVVAVGTALQIWQGNATLTQPKVAEARGVRIGEIKGPQIKELKNALRAEFAWAEKNWRKWRPK